jgi:hypothetical protein
VLTGVAGGADGGRPWGPPGIDVVVVEVVVVLVVVDVVVVGART